jgi:hypothetical protein
MSIAGRHLICQPSRDRFSVSHCELPDLQVRKVARPVIRGRNV